MKNLALTNLETWQNNVCVWEVVPHALIGIIGVLKRKKGKIIVLLLIKEKVVEYSTYYQKVSYDKLRVAISPASLVWWLLRLSVDSPHPLAPQTLTPRPLTPHHCVATLGLPRTRHLPLRLRHASCKLPLPSSRSLALLCLSRAAAVLALLWTPQGPISVKVRGTCCVFFVCAFLYPWDAQIRTAVGLVLSLRRAASCSWLALFGNLGVPRD